MRLIFMGTPDFAIPSLEALSHKYTICAVITAPDKPGGRGHQLIESPIKKYAQTRNFEILQPKNLKSPKFQMKLATYKADLFVVVAFRMLPELIWNMPKLGTINLHGSLLPKYRGAAPIQRAIMNGEIETGVSTFRLQSEIDTGDIIAQDIVPIYENDNFEIVYNKLKSIGAPLLVKTVDALMSGSAHFIKQELDANTPIAPKIFQEDCFLNFKKTCLEVHNQIRGLSPVPATWLEREGLKYKIYQSLKTTIPIGKNKVGDWIIEEPNKLYIACTDYLLEVKEIQQEGRKKLAIVDFINGIKSTRKQHN